MKKTIAMLLLLAAALPAMAMDGTDLKREQGISVYFNTEKLVQESAGESTPLQRFQSVLGWNNEAQGLLDTIGQRPNVSFKNGIWLILKDEPSEYSEEDLLQKKKLIELLKEKNIPMFECEEMKLSEENPPWTRSYE
jgi:hypothetical protein